ncbi:MAG: ammonia-forming cytochrome c nitrite reductase subunit c552 [Nitrospirae bacterium]|nr:ammonia-forming cytochrome c nitrite reductase subunit c552 [Nitrospirota bacterium]MCL5421827.1 ammonia-forming cytochrome c nitrite reductase subunit c552 [Nitrospirota bacterium]
MMKKFLSVFIAVAAFALISGIYNSTVDAEYKAAPGKKAVPAEKAVAAEACYGCHAAIKELHTMGKHAKVNCSNCHRGLDKHLKGPGPDTRPATVMAWEACGQCHKEQYESFMKGTYHRPARDEKSQLTNRAPNPFWDKLMAGHGFTKEHNLTRSHNWMLIDHLIVDRAYGGRFQGKNGWQYIFDKGKAWDVLTDKYPDNKEHKTFIPQSAAAANPVCLQCKTQDQILKWAYMGDPVQGTTWSRTSNVVEYVKDLNHGLNCFTCHDPHAAKPRIVRDGLIDALTRPDGDTLWHKDPKHTNIKVIEMGLRGFARKIALLEKYDTRLQCGQCHVEYNCNPGTDPKTGAPVKMDDRRTNHFPYKDVFGLYDHYVNKVSFLDFKHALTGGLLWKAQHPEAETYYNSKHAKAGAGCDSCHTPKVKDKKGKAFTSHFAATPRVQLKETCLKCHPKWTEEQARYAIDSVKAYGKGKMRKAEFWLSALIDKIVEGKKAGLGDDVIKQAQDQHLKAHILWEYWTAENSDGFHNPEMARESLTKSVDESQKGIKIIADAMTAKVGVK